MSETSLRAGLYARLSEVLGVEHAGTLMSYLPGEEPADKGDIRHLHDRMGQLDDRMDRFEERMDRFEDRMDRFEVRIEARFDRFDDRLDNFHVALRDQIRTFALVSVASILTTATLVAGIVQALVSSG